MVVWPSVRHRTGTLRVWDVASGKTLRVLEGHTDDVWCCALSADGRLALSASDGPDVASVGCSQWNNTTRVRGPY